MRGAVLRPVLIPLFALALGGCAAGLSERSSTGTTGQSAAASRESAPSEAGMLVGQGEMLLAKGRPEEACDKFATAGRLVPSNPRAGLGMGECLLALRHPTDALAYFEALLENPLVDKAGLRAQALQGRGLSLSMLGLKKDAMKFLTEAVAAEPKLWRAWNALGQGYDVMGRWDEAAKSYASALAANDKAAEIHNNQGMSLLLQKRHREAGEKFIRALSLDPDFEMAGANLRLALAWQGKYLEASADIPEGQLPQTFNNIGFVAMERGDYDLAEVYLLKAMQASPSFYERAAQNLERLKLLKKDGR